MNYLTVENISKSYGELQLFSDISFSIHKDDKIAFVAKNGSGKTSILKILTSEDSPDSGQVITRNNLKIAYLPQSPSFPKDITVTDSIYGSDAEILKVISNYEKALENPNDSDAYQKAFEQMELHNAWEFELRFKQILFKLKLEDLDKKVNTLSGGQKKRLALAQALISNPDLLIMDEPTNHLDLEMIEWLEDYFKKAQMTLFMVTHDRYFLERVCNEIIELDNGKLYTYKGNYSYYLEQKESRHEIEEVETQKAKQLFKKELEWMRRQPKARTTKSKARIDDFSDIKKRAHQRRKDHEVQLEINMERLGSKIVELHNISKSFGDNLLFKGFDHVFKKGERVGVIGKNGTGKSTFLNILTGSLKPDTGKVVVGETIKFGYYTQSGINIKPGQKVIEVIREYGDFIPLKKGRQISAKQLLQRFLFDDKKQYDYVEKLSGGEQKRLYLCTVLIQNPNFLILDEPTNDLDVITLNVLEEFLLDFPGCIVVVSHDRYFMDKIVDHLFVFQENGEIKDFPGNYSDFREVESFTEKKIDKLEEASLEKSQKSSAQNSSNKLSYQEKKELKTLENKLKSLEQEKTEIEKKFTNSSLSQEEIREHSQKLQTILDDIEEKEMRWLELSEKIES